MNKILTLAVGVILLSVLGITLIHNNSNSTTKLSFLEFKKLYKLEFDSVFQDNYRELVFKQNVAKIQAHNAQLAKTYTMEVNQFTHLTQQEFALTYLRLDVGHPIVGFEPEKTELVGDIDWVSRGAISPVRNQGPCGAGWVSCACDAIEGAWFVEKGVRISCSTQQLIDCTGPYGNHGCSGGLMENCYKYGKDHALCSSTQYPYTGSQGRCQDKLCSYNITGYVQVRGCPSLTTAIYNRPVSVAVDASNWSPYKSGIFNNCKESLNHGVLLVGMTDTYWKIKNSWGSSWGESGYIRLAPGNTCGICNFGSYPYITKP